MNNHQRARTALIAVQAFQNLCPNGDLDEAVSDLLCNLMHLLDDPILGLGHLQFDEVLERGYMHFESETQLKPEEAIT